MTEQFTADEIDAFMRRLKLLMAGAFALCVVPLLIYAFYLDQRLDAFEDSLRYRPPQETELEADDAELARLSATPLQGQVVYVPAYSHIYHRAGDPHLLTITLSVRNTSMNHGIIVRAVRYFDTKGQEVRSYVKRPLRLGPLATTEFLIEREDVSGGSGANFIVEWVADQPVSVPVIEAVMIDTDQQQGISFARQGVPVSELSPRSGGGAENVNTARLPN